MSRGQIVLRKFWISVVSSIIIIISIFRIWGSHEEAGTRASSWTRSIDQRFIRKWTEGFLFIIS